MYYICTAIKKMLLLHPNLREIIHKPILYLITKLQIMENVKKCPPRLPLTKCMVASFAVGLLLCASNASAADELARSVYSTTLTQQNGQVTGRVVDSNGEPLIGVSVVEKGNKGNGAVTDVDGNFTLRVSPKSTLLIS